jgi:hypothetical protein
MAGKPVNSLADYARKVIYTCNYPVLSAILLTAANTTFASELQYTTQKDDFSLQPAARSKVVEKTLVLPRSQYKYSLFQNYLHLWIDRPLFFDRELRYTGPFRHMMKDSFIREVDIVKSYEADGLANIAGNAGLLPMYKETENWLKEASPEKFHTLPEFGFEGSLTPASYNVYSETLKTALDSKYSVRINGKVLITSYVADHWTPAQIQDLLNRLRKDFGNTFLFVPDLSVNLYRQTQLYQNAGGKLPEQSDKEFKATLQEYLNAGDGLYFASYPRFRSGDNDYTVEFYSDFSDKYLTTVLLETMNKSENKGKLLGMSSAIGYINYLSGVNTGEYGTETLRKTFKAAAAVNPDFIILPEWNEVNENTCIQPTVANSLSTQRILKYCIRTLRGLPVTPNPGDDPTIPNLIVSYRETLKLGEAIRLEMLNVPDSSGNKTFTARLKLKTADGKLIKEFPLETFTESKMIAVTYIIPSEQLSTSQVLLPELTLTNQQGQVKNFKDLQYIRLEPTVCWNYKDIKQPLRDQLLPENVKFEMKKVSKDEYAATVELNSPEKLASVEILDNESEVYAYDRADEFKLSGNVIIQLHFIAGKAQNMAGKIFVRNASTFYFRPGEAANVNFVNSQISADGISVNQRINLLKRNVFIAIPKKDAEKAELEFELNIGKFKVPVKTLMEYGVYGKSLPNLVYILIERFDKVPDIPVRIKENNAAFKCNMTSEYRFPVYQLRAITESGKIFRGRPFVPEAATGKLTQLNVFSETAGKVATVSVQQDRIPDLKYIFNPDCGDLIRSGYERFWFGELGGGFNYGAPFHFELPSVTNTAPQWINSEEGWRLDFDGAGNEITFPREALPRGSFTLEFEARPQSRDNQVIFRHYGMYIGSVTLMIKNGKLFASFTDMKIKDNYFDTGLSIPAGQWSKFKISYNLNTMKFSVNGQIKEFPFAGRALYLSSCVFGGHTRKGFGIKEDMKFFKGQLKSLRIVHNAE